ncbi:hypothetical protein FHJ31_27235 [Pseudomonas sp. Fig-3]|nr:hypothetical protein FHJ31_27235 [Pseudomonas sp. Fig-3]
MHLSKPVARELAPVGLRSSPKAIQHDVTGKTTSAGFTTAAQPSGSKLPRHRFSPDGLRHRRPCVFIRAGTSSLPAAMGNTKNLSELTHLFSHCKQHASRSTSSIWLKE